MNFQHSHDFDEPFAPQERRRSRNKMKPSARRFAAERKDLVNGPVYRGRVVAIAGEGHWVDEEGKRYLCSLKGLLKKESSHLRNLVAVGDWVYFTPTTSQEGTIVRVEERTTVLSRMDISGRKEQLIAVNIDQVVIVGSIVEPPLKPALIDRYLIAAEKGKLHPLIAINKIDGLSSASSEEKKLYSDFLSAYEPLGIPILSLSAVTGVGMEALRSLLQNKTSVFSGQSGVGKSSLLNACFGFALRIGDLAQKTFKGTHTTTTAELLPLPGGGYCVDTPGIRSFAIWRLEKEDVLAHFTEFRPFTCKFSDCLHREEMGCAVQRAFAEGRIAPLRLASYQTLIAEALSGPDKMTWD